MATANLRSLDDARWTTPLDQLLRLRTAVQALMDRTRNVRERFEHATYGLATYLPSDFPKTVRPRFERIMNVRDSVRREYVGGTIFEFGQLSNPQKQGLREDIMALYEACLLDIGKLNGMGGLGDEVYEIVYPGQDATSIPTRAIRRRQSKRK